MAKIPRIEPGGARLTQQTGQATIDPGMASKESKAMGAFAEVSQKVAQHFETITLNNEIAQSKNESRKQIRDLTLQQEQDTDLSVDNQASYAERLAKIKEETAKNISLPIGKNEYDQWFDGKSLIADTKIKNNFRAKTLSAAKIELDNTVEELGEDYINESREMAELELDKEISEKASLGYWATNVEKDNYRDEVIESWREKEIDQDITNSENFVVDELEKKDGGVYSDLDADVRKKKLATAKAEQTKKRTIRQRNDSIKSNAIGTQLTLKALDPEGEGVSFDEVKLASEMKDSAGNQLLTRAEISIISRLSISSKKIGAVNHEATYRKLHNEYDKLFEEGQEEKVMFADVARFRNNMAEAVTIGRLKQSRADLWLKQTDQIFQSKLKGEELAGLQHAKAISRWFSKNMAKNKKLLPTGLNKVQEDKTLMRMNNVLMDKLEPNKDYTNEEITKMATNIWNAEVINNYPEVLGSGGIPNKVATKDGGVVSVSFNSVDVKGTTKPKPENDFIIFEAPNGKKYKVSESRKSEIEAKEGYNIVG